MCRTIDIQVLNETVENGGNCQKHPSARRGETLISFLVHEAFWGCVCALLSEVQVLHFKLIDLFWSFVLCMSRFLQILNLCPRP